MNSFALFTDSSCDLPQAMVSQMHLHVLPLHLHMDGRDYDNYPDEREIRYADFYARLPRAKDVRTSAVNQHEFIRAMEPVLQAGKDILYIGFSSGLSGTCSAGFMAAQELREKYPDRKIYCVDSRCASLGQGLLLYKLWQLAHQGKSIEEARDFAEDMKLRICHWFTVDDLMHLQRGGRLGGAAAVIGSVLNIKPIMHMDNEGRLAPVGKVHGRKTSFRQLLAEIQKRIIDPENQTIFISHGNCMTDAEIMADMIRKALPVKDVIINFVGPVIGAHSGPGTIAVFFIGSER